MEEVDNMQEQMVMRTREMTMKGDPKNITDQKHCNKNEEYL